MVHFIHAVKSYLISWSHYKYLDFFNSEVEFIQFRNSRGHSCPFKVLSILCLLCNCINSLDPKMCGCDFKGIHFKFISVINIINVSCEIVIMWKLQDLKDEAYLFKFK